MTFFKEKNLLDQLRNMWRNNKTCSFVKTVIAEISFKLSEGTSTLEKKTQKRYWNKLQKGWQRWSPRRVARRNYRCHRRNPRGNKMLITSICSGLSGWQNKERCGAKWSVIRVIGLPITKKVNLTDDSERTEPKNRVFFQRSCKSNYTFT